MHEELTSFKDFESVERVENLTVETERRTYLQQSNLQSWLNSRLGLLMASLHMPFCPEKLKNVLGFQID